MWMNSDLVWHTAVNLMATASGVDRLRNYHKCFLLNDNCSCWCLECSTGRQECSPFGSQFQQGKCITFWGTYLTTKEIFRHSECNSLSSKVIVRQRKHSLQPKACLLTLLSWQPAELCTVCKMLQLCPTAQVSASAWDIRRICSGLVLYMNILAVIYNR